MTKDQEAVKKKFSKYGKWAALPIAGIVAYPFVHAAIAGSIGILVCGGIALAAFHLVPVGAQMLASLKIRMMKAEAARHPIETKELILQEKMEAKERFSEHLETLYASIERIKTEIDEHAKKYPGTESRWVKNFNKFVRLYEFRKKRYKDFVLDVKAYSEHLDYLRSQWDIILAVEGAAKEANVGEDFMSKLKDETADNTIEMRMEKSMGAMEVALLDEEIDAAETNGANHALAVEERATAILDMPERMVETETMLAMPKRTRGRTKEAA